LDIYNLTALPALGFRQNQAGTGEMMACLTVKATCDIINGFPLVLSDIQDSILFDDVYLADPLGSSLMQTSDLVPWKPAADITMIANAFDPCAGVQDQFIAGLALDDRSYDFIISPRLEAFCEGATWRTRFVTAAGAPPLSWTNGFGGPLALEGELPFDVHRDNPLGCGALDLAQAPVQGVFRLPCIGSPEASPDPVPWGCAPVPPWWQPRQRFAGTYDAQWLSEVHPRLPDDFDYRFYQVAAPQLIQPGYLAAGSVLRLFNVLPVDPTISCTLPNWVPNATVRFKTNEVQTVNLNLDGCHIVLCGDRTKVVLTWRQCWPSGELVEAFRIGIQNFDDLNRERYAALRANRPVAWPSWTA
jgi:hypothetical protein